MANAGTYSPEQMERGRLLFAGPCEFKAGAATVEMLPPPGLPEVAFAGRSNVGKSSLVNALTGRKTLARVSNTPGRTQQLNFFELGAKLWLVDLPGYGYSKVGKQAAADWTRLTLDFLKGRPNLRRVLLMVDSRHGIKDSDEDVMGVFDEAAVVYQIVLTKADKTKPAELAATLAATQARVKRRVAAHPDVLVTSSYAGLGIPELRAEIAELA
ncbi:ribosome biogenesis GTP-binding protein YihA/YsxC [Ferrovibrio sp.]|uniref:ribosome biogenesis GTP-binding protein YihA/YsxC n=1 Tax=Ferrovibrio sp. TaxID=1917215 RepID=UPI0025BFD54C|nr:ribosome biogenesis GTP-binding protein YihA/YsxC [Ferrovibrio sp.]MBX3453032.1 ribosome biogenesis GTP-binding protein YihA/YsxC [Ferrovibrio sp.]